jgi:hypothetical protein
MRPVRTYVKRDEWHPVVVIYNLVWGEDMSTLVIEGCTAFLECNLHTHFSTAIILKKKKKRKLGIITLGGLASNVDDCLGRATPTQGLPSLIWLGGTRSPFGVWVANHCCTSWSAEMMLSMTGCGGEILWTASDLPTK